MELNKTGFKISIKDKRLCFKDPESGKEIASLLCVKYDRKRMSYIYSFQGVREIYKSELFHGEVRSVDWSVEKLLNPKRSTELKPNDIAALMHNSMAYELSGPTFSFKSNE